MLPLAIVGLLTAGLAGALFVFGGPVEDVGTSGSVAIPPAETANPPRPQEQRLAEGLDPGSLVRRGELGAAINALRAKELGGFVTLRVAPARVDAQLKSRDGRLSMVQVTAGPSVRIFATTGPSFGSIQTLDSGDIDPAAPERLVRAAIRRSDKRATQVDYLVLMGLQEPTWGLFFKDGTHFQGDASGRLTRKVSP